MHTHQNIDERYKSQLNLIIDSDRNIIFDSPEVSTYPEINDMTLMTSLCKLFIFEKVYLFISECSKSLMSSSDMDNVLSRYLYSEQSFEEFFNTLTEQITDVVSSVHSAVNSGIIEHERALRALSWFCSETSESHPDDVYDSHYTFSSVKSIGSDAIKEEGDGGDGAYLHRQSYTENNLGHISSHIAELLLSRGDYSAIYEEFSHSSRAYGDSGLSLLKDIHLLEYRNVIRDQYNSIISQLTGIKPQERYFLSHGWNCSKTVKSSYEEHLRG